MNIHRYNNLINFRLLLCWPNFFLNRSLCNVFTVLANSYVCDNFCIVAIALSIHHIYTLLLNSNFFFGFTLTNKLWSINGFLRKNLFWMLWTKHKFGNFLIKKIILANHNYCRRPIQLVLLLCLKRINVLSNLFIIINLLITSLLLILNFCLLCILR